ncbi:pilus motility taxis protein HmpF [Gloeomargaritales cyanobacterium VI4D9]|nr:pilus motility taxis protein HmpF [Gloeomargaritales cyanobacterium VI4D9]
MKYLAEIQRRQKTGFLGSTMMSSDVNVLAVQRGELWVATTANLQVDDKRIDSYGNGALVLIETNANNQVQQIQDAKPHVMGIMRQLAQLQEKLQEVERESAEMQQSLMMQAQEFHRRQMELEDRLAQVEQAEEAMAGLEEQQRQLQAFQAEIEALQAEIQRKETELQQAWAQLEQERSQLEANRVGVLTQAMAGQMMDCLERLRQSQPAGDSLSQWQYLLTQEQEFLASQWHQLEQGRQEAQQLAEQVQQHRQSLLAQWQQLREREAQSVAQERLAAHYQTDCDQLQNRLRELEQALHIQEQTCHQLKPLVGAAALVDKAALLAMNLEDLEREVAEKEESLHKFQKYVNEQEEELRMQQEAIDEIQARIQQANDYERIDLENELESEQQNYQFLEASLQGQRQTLAEREAIARAYREILDQRQGRSVPETKGSDLEPILRLAEQQYQRLQQERQTQAQILQERQTQLRHCQETLSQERSACAEQRHTLEQQQQELEQTQQRLDQLWGRLHCLQELLQPQQDRLDQTWHCYHQISQGASQGQTAVVEELLGLVSQAIQG